jgi:hypothetical protein
MGVTDNLVPFTPSGYPALQDGQKLWAVNNYDGASNSVTVIIETMKRLEAATSPLGHTHPESDITNLTTDLAALNSGKANVSHTHPESDITSLVSDLAGKAALSHTHAIADVTSLQSTLDEKEPLGKYSSIDYKNASYTLVLGDRGHLMMMDSTSGALNLTVPTFASVAYPDYTRIDIIRWGANDLTIVAAGGVTIVSVDGKLKLNKQYSMASLIKLDTGNPNTWILAGDLKA